MLLNRLESYHYLPNKSTKLGFNGYKLGKKNSKQKN